MRQGSFVKQHHSFFTFIQQSLDITLICISLWFAMLIQGISWSEGYVLAALTATICFFCYARYNGLYQSWRVQTVLEESMVAFKTCSFTFISLLVLAFALRSSDFFSRLVIGSWFLLSPALLIGSRAALRVFLRYKRASGLNTRTVAIAGAGPLGLALADSIEQSPWMGILVSGFYDDKFEPGSKINTNLGATASIIGDLNKLRFDARSGHYDAVYVALPMRAEKQMKHLIKDLADCSINVHYVPDIFTFNLTNSRIRDIGGIPTISVYDTPLDSLNLVFKRCQDLIFSIAILSLIALPMLLIAIAIKLDSSGTVLFKQRRYGLSGEEFLVWKFRTMTTNDDGSLIHQVTADDPRITHLGSLLRRTSLDELPQFINVLMGSMSIVGPRPHAVAHNELYRNEINDYMLRHIVKPGITGWAQINGWRGETDTQEKMQKRIEFDLHYIRNWSLWLDFKIIILTVIKGFIHKNAY